VSFAMKQQPFSQRLTDDPIAVLEFALEASVSRFGAALVTLVDIRGGAARALGALSVVMEVIADLCLSDASRRRLPPRL